MINAFGKGDLISGVFSENGAYHALSKAFPNVSGPPTRFPLNLNTTDQGNGDETRGFWDAVKGSLSLNENPEPISTFAAKGNLPDNISSDGTIHPETGYFADLIKWLDDAKLSLADWTLRLTIIVLGFIFVAVGLAMFKAPQPINIVSAAAKVV